MKYDAWDKHYKENFVKYSEIFDKCMSENNIENVNFPTFGWDYSVPLASATDALHFSLMAYNIGEGDEVLVSDFSWISSASCISMVGATPVFCDIDLETYTISFESIKRMVSDKTKAIVYTHLFGDIADNAKGIMDWCKTNNIKIIEDAAQSLGSYKGSNVAGQMGDCASFSFNSNKVVAGINGGGVFLTNNRDLADYVDKASRHGRNEFLGRNSKAYLLNTEIIKYRLSEAEMLMAKRQEIAKIYDEELCEDFIVPNIHEGHNFHKYVIRTDNLSERENLRKATRFSVHYPTPISMNPMYEKIDHRKDDCSNAQTAANTVISLPINPYMTKDEINNVVNKILMY